MQSEKSEESIVANKVDQSSTERRDSILWEQRKGKYLLWRSYPKRNETETRQKYQLPEAVKENKVEIINQKKSNPVIEEIQNYANLERAFRKVKKNRGGGGIDAITLKQYEKRLRENLKGLAMSLENKTYQPLPVKRVYIPKANGKKRPLGIPTIRDRIVQEAVRSAIEPFFEQKFSDASYGFRPGKARYRLSIRCNNI